MSVSTFTNTQLRICAFTTQVLMAVIFMLRRFNASRSNLPNTECVQD